VIDLATEFKGLIIFAEHRYFGTSIPEKGNISYCTIEQALADYANFLTD